MQINLISVSGHCKCFILRNLSNCCMHKSDPDNFTIFFLFNFWRVLSFETSRRHLILTEKYVRGIKAFRLTVDHSGFVVKTKEDKTHSMTERPNDIWFFALHSRSTYILYNTTGLFISFHTLEMSCFWWTSTFFCENTKWKKVSYPHYLKIVIKLSKHGLSYSLKSNPRSISKITFCANSSVKFYWYSALFFQKTASSFQN